MVTAGDLLSRMSASIYGCSPGGGLHPWQIKLVSSEIPVVDDRIRVRAVDRHVLVSDHWRVDEVDRRVVARPATEAVQLIAGDVV